MKHLTYLCLTIILLAFFSSCSQTLTLTEQTVYPNIAKIINQMPAESSEQRDILAAKLVAMNPESTTILTNMLLPPNSPEDHSVRYGLSALTHYVSRNGAEAERKIYAKALINALKTVPNEHNKAFLIEQLQLAGKAEAVKPLARYLNDTFLCDYATRALLTIETEAVESTFLKALKSADSVTKPTIIKALGELKSTAASKEITKFAMSSDFYTRETALYALANIGDPASESILKNACSIGNNYEQTKNLSQYLLYACRLAETGNQDLFVQICKMVSGNNSLPEHIRTAANKMLYGTSGQIPDGFISLFNGKDLSGWKRHEGLPGDIKPMGKWFVKDGAIIGVQDPPEKGGFLSTVETFRDFELLLETKIDWPFDTGVFMRVGPDGKSHQVTLDYRDGGEIGSIYCPWTMGFVDHCPDGINSFKKDQWNQLRIICQGEPARIQVWLNGTQITDFQHTKKTTAGIPAEGTICLQVHPGGKGYDKSKASFRNIYIRPLESARSVNTLTVEEKAEGFVSIFNGKDLTGWVGSKDTYAVKDNVLFCRKGTGRNIYTEKQYDNFILRFEFRLESGTNNGLGIRVPLEGDAAYVGMELQILDNTAEKYSNLHDWQYHGSIYGIAAADKMKRYSAFKPIGEWNYEEVVADGNRIIVKVNGETIVDADIKEATKNGTLSGKEHPGLFNKAGHIGFLGHGDYVEFRNIRIKEL